MKRPKKLGLDYKNEMVKPVFVDKRGSIFDFVEEKVGHIGMVTFNKGVTRGNHYHKKSYQYSYVIEGKLKLVLSDLKGNKKEMILTPGMLTTIPPRIIHTYTSMTKARLLDISTMSRTDDGYEDDTVRV